jgi:hypothetical protein
MSKQVNINGAFPTHDELVALIEKVVNSGLNVSNDVQALGVKLAQHCKASYDAQGNGNVALIVDLVTRVDMYTGLNAAALMLWFKEATPVRFSRKGETITASLKAGGNWDFTKLENTKWYSLGNKNATEKKPFEFDTKLVDILRNAEKTCSAIRSGKKDATGQTNKALAVEHEIAQARQNIERLLQTVVIQSGIQAPEAEKVAA